MNPIDFPYSNRMYAKPDGWTDEQCQTLAAYQGINEDGHSLIISCWSPTPEEIKDIVSGKPIWLHVLTNIPPPVLITTQDPFPTPEIV